MSEFIDRQSEVIERTGMGLLPGITVAFILAMGAIAAILFETWWSVGFAVVGIIVVTGVVFAVLVGLMGSEHDTYSDAG
jgi:hypothetical protein